MKKISVFLIVVMVMMVLALSGCGTTQNAKVDVDADKVVVVDWTDRTLGEPAIPKWLKDMCHGNSDTFKENWKVDASRVVKLSHATGKTEPIAQALSRAGFAYTQASELNQKVIGRVGRGLNDLGQLEALSLAASETKADMTGLREEYSFCQKVRVKDDVTKEISEYYNYYIIYSMDKATWDALCKKYLMDVMGGANLETETQKKIGALFTEMKEDADKKDLKKAQEEAALYREQMARLEGEKGALNANTKLTEQEAAIKKATEEAAKLESYLM